MTRTVFENAIEATGLAKRYGEVQALDGVDLHVEAGTVFGLLGPNGAGKSTTVRILTTLSRPDAGTVRVAGVDALRDPVGVRRAIGVVGQKHGIDAEATGRENLVLQAELYGLRDRGRVDELLERFGLADAAGPAREDLLGRHAAAPGRRARAHPRAAGAVPGRAHDRAGPRGAHGDVGRDRAARARGADDDPAHDALPRGGRPARLPDRDRRPRPDRRARDAGRAQGRAVARATSRRR